VHVLSRIQGMKTIHQYASKLYQSRFQALYPADSLVMLQSDFACYGNQPDVHKQVVYR
jgi:hypothetical protein